MPRLFSRTDVRKLSVIWRRRRPTYLAPPFKALSRRIVTASGAILLGLVALAFARAGDWAQHVFARHCQANGAAASGR